MISAINKFNISTYEYKNFGINNPQANISKVNQYSESVSFGVDKTRLANIESHNNYKQVERFRQYALSTVQGLKKKIPEIKSLSHISDSPDTFELVHKIHEGPGIVGILKAKYKLEGDNCNVTSIDYVHQGYSGAGDVRWLSWDASGYSLSDPAYLNRVKLSLDSKGAVKHYEDNTYIFDAE